MDISIYISELLFEHDCVIIPDFGGLVCNYKPSEIHPVLNLISPPSKAIAFNKNLQRNDGLLISYIAQRKFISFDMATALVAGWVTGSKSLLKAGDRIELTKIGELYTDIETNIQFAQNTTQNYLRTSYGLKTFFAEPVIHAKEIKVVKPENPEIEKNSKPSNFWKIAAIIILLVAMAGLTQLMWLGVEIKPLHADEANFSALISQLLKIPESELKPVPIEINKAEIMNNEGEEIPATEINAEVTPSVSTTTSSDLIGSNESNAGYYIIIGAFKSNHNIQSATEKLTESHKEILLDTQGELTRVGYFAGPNFATAKEQLKAAQKEDSSYWLLKR